MHIVLAETEAMTELVLCKSFCHKNHDNELQQLQTETNHSQDEKSGNTSGTWRDEHESFDSLMRFRTSEGVVEKRCLEKRLYG